MAFKATLTIENKTFNLLECWSRLEQQTDNKGRPKSEVRGGSIMFVVLGTEDNLLPAWAADKKKKHDGEIELYQWDQDTKFKEISFKNAFVTYFTESYAIDPEHDSMDWLSFKQYSSNFMFKMAHRIHAQFNTNYLFLMEISAEQIKINGIEHNNRW